MAPEQPLPDARLVDLFAGPGGLDVAATWLGIHSVGVEWDDDACATRAAAGLRTEHADVRKLGPSDFPTATILTAGPPCQTFTVAGSGNGRRALQQVVGLMHRMDQGSDVINDVAALDDERTGLVLQPLRWILEAEAAGRPYEAIVLEQVPAVLPLWNELARVLRRHHYRTAVDVLRTEEFGVPQTRRRAVLLAHRDHQPLLPEPTHRVYRKGVARSAGNVDLLPWTTIGETIKRRGHFVAVSNYGTGGDPSARGRRTSKQPAATITGKIDRTRLEGPGITESRSRLTIQEAGRLQTFPARYPWSGRRQSQQVGNAIPPRLGAHVLAAVLDRVPPDGMLDNLVREKWSPEVREANFDRLLPRAQALSRSQELEPMLFNF
ncbi:DNA cytosine methyltransferase [Actinomycetospora sp. CA-084318]|uniref:DNA cytosine methyltransferase n=1 Tax=Actinomycetospora sp. CA-084318 TaxID=3239892 RepID=UPI003D995AE6